MPPQCMNSNMQLGKAKEKLFFKEGTGYAKPMVLNWEQVFPQGTFVEIRRHFWLS